MLSDDYVVMVDGRVVDVYRGVVREDLTASYGGPFSFAYFDFGGVVEVSILCKKAPLDRLVVQPLSKGIVWKTGGNRITFMLDSPCQLSIEPDLKRGPLLLFANPLARDAPDPGARGVRYFGPGIHEAGAILLHDDEMMYVAGGAIVKGGVHASGKNITIRGRGIIDGLDWPRGKGPTRNIIGVQDSSNVSIDGIIIKDGWMWNLNLVGSTGVTIRNVKIVASRCANNDGIDICNTQHVSIEDTFIRTDDDCIAPKGMDYAGAQAVDDIRVTRCVLWTDLANVWRIGCESRAQAMRNMTFTDIDVIHCSDSWADQPFGVNCITLQPGEEMPMEGVRFEDIRIHYAKEPTGMHGRRNWPVGTGDGHKILIEVRPQWTQWALKKAPGRLIKDVYFKNIVIDGEDECQYGIVHVSAPDEQHPVLNVTFENVVRGGTLITKASPKVEVQGAVHDVRFLGPTDCVAIPRIRPRRGFVIGSPVEVSIDCETG
jgi:hypothetical protein